MTIWSILLLIAKCLAAPPSYLIPITEESNGNSLSVKVYTSGAEWYETSVYLTLRNSVSWLASDYCYTANCLTMTAPRYLDTGSVSSQAPEQVLGRSVSDSVITGSSVVDTFNFGTWATPNYTDVTVNRIDAMRVTGFGDNRLPGVIGLGPGNVEGLRLTPIVSSGGFSQFSMILYAAYNFLILGEQNSPPGVNFRAALLISGLPLYKQDDTWNYQITNFGTNTGSSMFFGGTGMAVLSTDQSIMQIPKAMGSAMAAQLGATVVSGAVDTYNVNCSATPTLGSIIFSTPSGNLTLTGWQIAYSGVGTCNLKVVGKDEMRHGLPVWTLGIDFLRCFNILYDATQPCLSFYVPDTPA
ncbi:hypothetical protein PSACC_03121 [Paramicrosporidium saccamoebae]|uniref:Peptidase A1 domain-containing protein n=1 Tax=Paramicrosporidium saccamoebae TaxID=1246581 RepID=A0A2H9TH33_9FUNG|nr:hypothetical protein PSACC_03121 [Paramicrosporidium saccamoebae]